MLFETSTITLKQSHSPDLIVFRFSCFKIGKSQPRVAYKRKSVYWFLGEPRLSRRSPSIPEEPVCSGEACLSWRSPVCPRGARLSEEKIFDVGNIKIMYSSFYWLVRNTFYLFMISVFNVTFCKRNFQQWEIYSVSGQCPAH